MSVRTGPTVGPVGPVGPEDLLDQLSYCATLCYMEANIGVRELRQNLSVYLDRVKKGETLTVTEHRQVVAILRPAPVATDLVSRLVAEGRATAARRTPAELPRPSTIKLKKPLSHVLDELREDKI